jgi:hypothetical protein
MGLALILLSGDSQVEVRFRKRHFRSFTAYSPVTDKPWIQMRGQTPPGVISGVGST